MTRAEGSLSFVHAADLHLDTPFLGVQANAPFVAAALRDASLAAFEEIVELALVREVDFVLFAGDIYDGAERGIRAQTRLRDGLRRLSAAGIQSFIVHGNHDPIETGWSALATSWPAGVTIFGTDEARVVEVLRDGTRIATVQGVSYKQRATLENLSKHFARPEGPGIHIGLLHCNVAGVSAGYANYSPCTIADLRATGLDYLALGHVHERRILAGGDGSGGPWIVYPGNTQSRTINERGAKGVYLVQVNQGVIEPPEFVACDTIRFIQCTIAIDACTTLADLDDLFAEHERRLIEENGPRSVIVRATLTGRTALHQLLSGDGPLDELLEVVRSRGRAVAPFCWWERLIDQSSPLFDLEEIKQRNDFASDLLEMTDALEHRETGLEELAGELLEMVPKSYKKDLGVLLADRAFVNDLLTAARLRALDEILSDG